MRPRFALAQGVESTSVANTGKPSRFSLAHGTQATPHPEGRRSSRFELAKGIEDTTTGGIDERGRFELHMGVQGDQKVSTDAISTSVGPNQPIPVAAKPRRFQLLKGKVSRNLNTLNVTG